MKRSLFFLVAILITGSVSAADAKPKAPKIAALEILESYAVPALEISGLAWRRNPETRRRELVVVGDRDQKVYLIDWDRRKTEFKPREIELKGLFVNAVSEQSEWESVFSDDTGRLFIVQENPPQIVVVSADLTRIEARIALALPAAPGEENSGGEGLLPLRNGHILVVKEKNPLQILEFALKGSKPEGYKPRLSIEGGGSFPLPQPQSAEFQPVFDWRLFPEHEALFEDSSGLNADPDGTLYLLGDQRNLIGRIGKSLKKGKSRIRLDRLWSLPSTIRQPEGMVIDSSGRPIVAIDTKNTTKPNLFLLSPMK